MVPTIESFYIFVFIFTIFEFLIFFTSIEQEVTGWDRNVIRNASYYITEDEMTHIIPENVCKDQFKLLIMVTSAPSNTNARQAIRETWGSEKIVLGQHISLTFFIGNSLNPYVQDEVLAESNRYGDIIQGHFLDTYYNLTLKSILVMKVAADRCMGKAQYLLKIDDDMFLQVPKLMEFILLKNNKSENILIGKMTCDANPIKNPFSKWYCPTYLYNKTFYPNFLSGTAYLMSMDTTRKLYNTAMTTPLFHLEDVYLTGICAENAGIFPEHNVGFTTGVLYDEPCLLKDLITMHQFSPTRMSSTFKDLTDASLLEKCKDYERMFSAQMWIETILFMPFSRSRRKRICQ